jgi:cyclopropane-fatty-acyl-phospholipid synthase
MRVLSQYLKKITTGQLTISCPRGEQLIFGQGQPQAHIIVDDYRFFNALVFKSDIGLADAFIHQFWRTNHLQSVFDLFINNPAFLNSSNPFIRLKKRTLQFQHLLNANSITRAKKNIFDHYDLGNDFFNLFLDQHRVYSSAIFDQPDQSIEDAQLNKIRHAIRLADIQPHHRLLEIGSGWGALAIEAASSIGCHVTTVTISQEQYRFVKQEINRRHLDAKIEVKLMDYRLLTGKFDRIISIEMLEAVGHNYLNTYFRKCNDLLLRNGKAMFQCIMIPHNRYHLYLKSQDFIQKYIFPGGHLPSIETLKSVTANANFSWLHTVPITSHYVKTLLIWEQNFIRQLNRVRALGFNQHFIQTWIYYFNYCIAGFKSDVIQNYQFLIQKQH